ncbi:MAG: hypothetical protein KAU95_01825, partial [Candidatus Aenigmarchaeota archaeon]|nr:hypothetical protein [Candidatus Aenigmarchaeota archaeon]
MVEEKAMEGLNVYKDSVNLGDREKLVDLGDGYMSWNETPGKKNMEGARSLRKEDLEYYGRQLLSGHDYHTRFDSDGTGEIAYDSKKGFTLIDSKKNEFPVSSDRTFNFDYFFPEFSPGLMGGVTERVKNPKMDKWKKVGALVGAGLVLASPVADIGGVEVASAKLVYKNPSGEIVVNVDSDYRANSIDSEFPMIDFPKAKDYEANSGLPKFGGISTHTVLAKLLTESRENPNSQYSPIYNDEQFDKYLDSIVSDAQKAGETGVKSLIPTPEGEFLDIITEGAYGKASDINTIAQMGWYLQNIS